jgi:Tfp pilus assembly protein PilN
MGKTYATGLILRDGGLEWTTVLGDRGRLQVAARGAWVAPAPAAEGAEAAGAPPAAGHDALAESLRKQARSFRGALAVGLASDQLLIRVVTLPSAERTELAGMVELQFDKISPFPVEQMVFSHEVLAQKDSSSVVLIAGVKADVVEAVEKTLDQAEALPGRVDAAVLAWWQLLVDAAEVAEQGRQTILLRHPGGADIIVAEGRTPIAFRFLGQSPDLAEEVFEDEVVEEVGYTLMSLELEHGLDPKPSLTVWQADGATGGLAAKLGAARGCLVATKSLAALPALSEGLARRAAGAGARAGLDLTPASWRRVSQSRQFKHRMLVTAEVLVGVWILGVLAVMGGTTIEGRKLADLREQAAKRRGPAQEVRDMKARLKMINRYMDWRYSAIECLREVSAVLPDGVDLQVMNFKKGENVKLSGEAQSVEQVYDLKNKLDASRMFTSNTFTRAPAAIAARGKFSFEIDLKFSEGD